MSSDKAIATALAVLSEAFPSRDVTKRTAQVWKQILENTSDETLERAVLHICRNPDQRFFPTTGEVFAAIRETTPRRIALMPPVEPPRERLMPMLANPNHPRPLASTAESVLAELKQTNKSEESAA